MFHWILQHQFVVLAGVFVGGLIAEFELLFKLDKIKRDLFWTKEGARVMEHTLECSRNMWRDDYNSLKKLQGLTESAVNAWIKDYNLLAEENICLIRSIKEAQQEVALEKVQTKYYKGVCDEWRVAFNALYDIKPAIRKTKKRKA